MNKLIEKTKYKIAKIKSKEKIIGTDTALKGACIFLFALVLISQIGLKIPFAKGFFTDIEVFEGTAVGEDAVREGVVTLSLLSGEPKNELEILVNGEKVDVFDRKEKKLELLSTSVIEIKSLKNEKCTVKITDMTDNLYAATACGEVSVTKGINFVGRIILKNN